VKTYQELIFVDARKDFRSRRIIRLVKVRNFVSFAFSDNLHEFCMNTVLCILNFGNWESTVIYYLLDKITGF
jgi:hypothetical protein